MEQWGNYSVSSETTNSSAQKLYAEPVVCGGPHGDFFDDYNYLYQKYTARESMNPVKLHIYAGSRADAIAMEYADGQMVKHGGDGGTHYGLEIPEGVYITRIVAYNGKKNNQTRVFGLQAVFSDGTQSPVYRSVTKDVTVPGATAENGQIVGIYGRNGRPETRHHGSRDILGWESENQTDWTAPPGLHCRCGERRLCLGAGGCL